MFRCLFAKRKTYCAVNFKSHYLIKTTYSKRGVILGYVTAFEINFWRLKTEEKHCLSKYVEKELII